MNIYVCICIYIVLFCKTYTSCLLCVLYVSILLWFLGFHPLTETARKAMEHVYGNAVASAGGFSALLFPSNGESTKDLTASGWHGWPMQGGEAFCCDKSENDYPQFCGDDFIAKRGTMVLFYPTWRYLENSIGVPVSLVACEATTMYITSGMHSDDVVRDCQLMWNREIKWLQLGQIKEELYSIIVNSPSPIQNLAFSRRLFKTQSACSPR